MDNELRKAMYVAAAIQGMLTAEGVDQELNNVWVADRAVEIADAAIAIESGEFVNQDNELVPVHELVEAEPETPEYISPVEETP